MQSFMPPRLTPTRSSWRPQDEPWRHSLRTIAWFVAFLLPLTFVLLLLPGCDEPVIAELIAVAPLAAGDDASGELGIDGRNLSAPMRVSFEDENGNRFPQSMMAEVAADGRRAIVRMPENLQASDSLWQIIVRNGNQQTLRSSQRFRCDAVPVRSIDGNGNNAKHPYLGRINIALRRMVPADYADGDSAMAGINRPNPREISNATCWTDGPRPAASRVSNMFWQWGQFLDHDIDLTPGAEPQEAAHIPVPTGDAWFDPASTGTVLIEFTRSAYAAGGPPRQQLNAITAFIDASNVYGSDPIRQAVLRTLDGSGKLKTSAGDLLPFNTSGLPNAGGPSPTLFLAGDVRANEQTGLTCMHTLFVREHNRLADEIATRHPDWTGDQIYEAARRMVGAQVQVITVREFLPLLLGDGALPAWQGYQPDVDPSIGNEFSTAAYRFGHSMLTEQLWRLDASGNEIPDGHLSLAQAFFNPSRIINEGGIEPVLRGLSVQAAQELDLQLVDAVRNFLFGPPGAGGLDLACLNIQRGRDHGLASYNDTRQALGLSRRASFDEVTSDSSTRDRLAAVYASVDDIDLWVGGLAEDHQPGAMIGETFHRILLDQFRRLRDGDRYWYAGLFTDEWQQILEQTRLSDIIRRNTTIGDELPDNVFVLPAVPPQLQGAPLPAANSAQ